MKKRNKPVIPGFGLSMGITISILSLVVLIPLASLVIYTAKLSFKDFIETITRARVLASFYTSFISAFAAAVINGIMGTILAWVLVKYEFPGKRIMDGMIELPFALPTAVAGIALTSLTSDSGLVGSFFATLLPLLLYHFTHVGTVDACVAGALMPLLPGLAMTNAVQDTMRGDIVSGVAHGMNAILTATLVAGGALIASSLYHVLMGGA